MGGSLIPVVTGSVWMMPATIAPNRASSNKAASVR